MKSIIVVLLAVSAAAAKAVPLTVTWDAPAGYFARGYMLGYGAVSGVYATTVDVGSTRVFTIDALVPGQTYYLSVMAYGDAGISSWSNEVVVTVLPDPPPTGSVSPVVGLWGNAAEPGTGYSLDYKHGVLVVTVYSYNDDGSAQWYLASGPLMGATFASRLYRFTGGQCISCAYTGAPADNEDAGSIGIEFSASDSAVVRLPGGRITSITPTAF